MTKLVRNHSHWPVSGTYFLVGFRALLGRVLEAGLTDDSPAAGNDAVKDGDKSSAVGNCAGRDGGFGVGITVASATGSSGNLIKSVFCPDVSEVDWGLFSMT